MVLQHILGAPNECFPDGAKNPFVFVFLVLLPIEYIDVLQQRFDVTRQLSFFCLGFNDHISVTGIEVELAIRRGEVVHATSTATTTPIAFRVTPTFIPSPGGPRVSVSHHSDTRRPARGRKLRSRRAGAAAFPPLYSLPAERSHVSVEFLRKVQLLTAIEVECVAQP